MPLVYLVHDMGPARDVSDVILQGKSGINMSHVHTLRDMYKCQHLLATPPPNPHTHPSTHTEPKPVILATQIYGSNQETFEMIRWYYSPFKEYFNFFWHYGEINEA